MVEHAGKRLEATAVVAGAVREDYRGVQCPIEVRTSGGEKVLLRVRDGGDGEIAESLERGRLLRVQGRVVLPEDPTTGFNERQFLARRGMRAIIESGSAGVDIRGFRGGVEGLLDRVRSRSRRHLGRGLDEEHAGLLRGVILGEKRGVPDRIMEDFRRSGVAHMLAVSGLHVGSLAAIFLGVSGFIPISRRMGVLGSMCAVGLFVPFTGAGASVVRAAVMIVLVLAAEMLGRGRDRWQALLLAAFLILARNPLDIYSAAFQLSFGAVTGLFLFVRPLEEKLSFLPGGMATGVAVSTAATLGTAPVAIVVFGQASLVAVGANLLVVPVLPVVMALGLTGMVTGFLWAPLSVLTNLPAAVVLEWAVRVAEFFAWFPVLKTDDLPRVAAGLAGGVLMAPLAWRTGRKRRYVGGGVLLVGLGIGALLYPSALDLRDRIIFWSDDEGWPERAEVRILDVGQGSAALLRAPGRTAVLIDGGPEDAELAPKLRRLGVRRLNMVVVSHPHADHFAGLSSVAGAIPVDVLVDDISSGLEPDKEDLEEEEEAYLELRRAFARGGTEHWEVEEKQSVKLKDARVELAFHTNDVFSGPRVSPNEESVLVVVRAGDLGILLPGDAEADVLRRHDLEDVDVLAVPHHGSRGAVRRGLLEELGVKVACISVGRDNTFGHPDEGTLSLLREEGVRVFRTDRKGWVSLREGSTGVEVWTEKNPGGKGR